MERIQKAKAKEQEETPVDELEATVAPADLTDTDNLLDEIDAVLEANDAAEFIRNFVQKGGE